jgi:hypothetical protein
MQFFFVNLLWTPAHLVRLFGKSSHLGLLSSDISSDARCTIGKNPSIGHSAQKVLTVKAIACFLLMRCRKIKSNLLFKQLFEYSIGRSGDIFLDKNDIAAIRRDF